MKYTLPLFETDKELIMLKILLIAAVITILAFILFAMMCAMIVAGRSDEQADMENNEGADEMFWKKQICPKCKVGQETYRLDSKSEACPFIHCWKDNKCSAFEPIEKPSKNGIFSNIKNKQSVPPPKNRTLQAVLRGFRGGCVTQIK